MNSLDLENYSDKIQDLQNNIVNDSNFHGPIFNTESFKHLIKKEFFYCKWLLF